MTLEGLADHLGTLLVARRAGRVVGCAALEVYSDGALLRSVAVQAESRSLRLGRALTDAVLRLAGERHVPAVYLLTMTAADYFCETWIRANRAGGCASDGAGFRPVHDCLPSECDDDANQTWIVGSPALVFRTPAGTAPSPARVVLAAWRGCAPMEIGDATAGIESDLAAIDEHPA